jgi:hypothetical protein
MALKSWTGNGSSELRPPHLLVHILGKKYNIVPLRKSMSLNKRDARDIKNLKEGLRQAQHRVLFASVEKALGCVTHVDRDEVQRWQQSQPEIEPAEDQEIILDELVLERVVDLNGSIVGNRMPVRDSEIVQEDRFSYESAKIKTHIEEENDHYGETECLSVHQ